MPFDRLTKEEVLKLGGLLKKSKMFPASETLEKFLSREETHLYLSNTGIAAIIGRWRKHLSSLVIWEIIPSNRARVAVIKDLVQSLKELGFSEILSPFLIEEQLGPYFEAGFREFEVIAKLEKRNYLIPEIKGPAELRAATKEDLRGLLKLERRAFPSFWWLDGETFSQFTVDHHFLVALLKGDIVGYNISNTLSGQGVVYRLGVGTLYQRQGVGSQLLAAAIEWFKEKGVKLITLTTQEGNRSGIELYMKFGFVVLPGRLYILVYNF